MANSKATSNYGNFAYNGKQSLRPPRSPFPSISPSYADHGSNPTIGSKVIPRPMEGRKHHQRTSSESFLIEEQPSWLDELLNEPETPVRRGGHRRSSSDSFTYLDVAKASNVDHLVQDSKFKKLTSMNSWGSQGFVYNQDARRTSFSPDLNSFQRQRNMWEPSSFDCVAYQTGLPSTMDNTLHQSSGSLCVPQDQDRIPCAAIEKKVQEDDGSQEVIDSSDRRECSLAKPSASETDPKRAKQQFAQRSRVRKLQYIAELERNVQTLQAEGSEISAEIDFLEQQNLILNMENKALKQRLDTVAQEQLIKYLEHEMLEKEIIRLQSLYQQQQQQQQRPPSHRRSKSKDLDFQFANLSLKHENAGSAHDRLSAHSSSNSQ